MPDDRGNDEKINGNGSQPFMTEKIVGRRDRGRRAVLFVLRSCLAGILFAAAAVATMVFALPGIRDRIPGQGSTMESVQIEKDERESTAAPETQPAESESPAAPETSPAGTEAVPETKPVEDVVRDVVGSYEFTTEDFLKITGTLRAAADAADLSVASVTRHKEERDWFENSVQTSGTCSGCVIARTGTELLVLTTEEAVEGTDTVTVTFGREVMEAYVKRVDTLCGLAVVGIPVTDENRASAERITPIALGNSYRVNRGDFLIAVGAPLGIIHSVDYGVASSVQQSVSVTDGTAQLIYTGAKGSAESGTWILNTDGEMVGWVSNAYDDSGDEITTVVGVSDYKVLLERMMNGQASPWIGIRGAAVTQDLTEQGVPSGVYVSRVGRSSPAYSAGIQPGDIIVRVGDAEIRTLRDYAGAVEKMHAEDAVRVTVMRNGRDEYTQIEFTVTVGAR